VIAFDNTINLGHVLTFVGFVITGVGRYFALKGRLQRIEWSNNKQSKMIDGLQLEIKKITDVLIALAKFEERMVALRQDVQELKRDVLELKKAR
jgi:hypothetical protein